MRKLVVLSAAVAALSVLFGGASHAGLSSAPFHVYFTDGEDVYPVTRTASSPTLKTAMKDLLAGPTSKEHGLDVRTWIPHGTQLRSARIRHGIAPRRSRPPPRAEAC